MTPEHYEVELRELAYEDDDEGGLRVMGMGWYPIQVFKKDTVPMPLTFDVLSAAQAYVGRNQPGTIRIVRVMDGASGRWLRRAKAVFEELLAIAQGKNPAPK
jgi:hypothetical protein